MQLRQVWKVGTTVGGSWWGGGGWPVLKGAIALDFTWFWMELPDRTVHRPVARNAMQCVADSWQGRCYRGHANRESLSPLPFRCTVALAHSSSRPPPRPAPARSSFKCPYCPQEAKLDGLRPITFPDMA